MKLKTRVFLYLVIVATCVLANYLLWRYRLHLYYLDTDYEREPLHDGQMMLVGATLAIIIGSALLLLAQVVREKRKTLTSHNPDTGDSELGTATIPFSGPR